jgi:hypothetical protein
MLAIISSPVNHRVSALPPVRPPTPGATFSGTIARIAHAVDVTTRTMAVEIDVEKQAGGLPYFSGE